MKNLVKITKIKDLRFKGRHPNYINEGSIHIGVWVRNPKVNERFFIDYYNFQYHNRGFITSLVEEILDENTFKTTNSIYQWELISEKDANKHKTSKL